MTEEFILGEMQKFRHALSYPKPCFTHFRVLYGSFNVILKFLVLAILQVILCFFIGQEPENYEVFDNVMWLLLCSSRPCVQHAPQQLHSNVFWSHQCGSVFPVYYSFPPYRMSLKKRSFCSQESVRYGQPWIYSLHAMLKAVLTSRCMCI